MFRGICSHLSAGNILYNFRYAVHIYVRIDFVALCSSRDAAAVDENKRKTKLKTKKKIKRKKNTKNNWKKEHITKINIKHCAYVQVG